MLFPALDTIFKERVFRSVSAKTSVELPPLLGCCCRQLHVWCPPTPVSGPPPPSCHPPTQPPAHPPCRPPTTTHHATTPRRRQARAELKEDLDLFVVNSIGSLGQSLFVFLLLPIMTALRGMSLADLPGYLAQGECRPFLV